MRRTVQVNKPDSERVWLELVPDDHKEVVLLGVFSFDGKSTLSGYRFDVADGMIKIDFGIHSHNGYFKYTYEDGVAPLDSTALIVSGAITPSGSTFEFEDVTFVKVELPSGPHTPIKLLSGDSGDITGAVDISYELSENKWYVVIQSDVPITGSLLT